MSTDTHAGHGHHDDHAHDDGAAHGTLRSYATGFVLSVILTAIPFWLVMSGALPDKAVTIAVVLAMAAVQIVVHMIYFLHMSPKVEAGWSMLALVFTVMVIVIALSGSIWVMYHLNANMMPMSAEQMRDMP
ncbi:MAG TPA: cytochrome o ubiquinol oxidase subunit IV [Devosiaceae bacterium]|nr:cytochrome o ubiquinol oxidase subunit IV [Devosiaceae bacterium]